MRNPAPLSGGDGVFKHSWKRAKDMLKHVLSKIRHIGKDIQHDQPVEFAAVAENIYAEILNLNNYINKTLDDRMEIKIGHNGYPRDDIFITNFSR